MKRSPLVRKSHLERSGRIRHKKRPANSFARIYGSKARVAWVKSLNCLYCNRGPNEDAPSHNAHTETGGIAWKAGFQTIIPLCAEHHRMFDDHVAPFDKEELRDVMQSAALDVEDHWQRVQR